MNNNPLAIALILLIALCIGFGVGFAAGRHYEREHSDYFNLRINEEGVQIDKRNEGGKGRVVAPFVDIEYDK